MANLTLSSTLMLNVRVYSIFFTFSREFCIGLMIMLFHFFTGCETLFQCRCYYSPQTEATISCLDLHLTAIPDINADCDTLILWGNNIKTISQIPEVNCKLIDIGFQTNIPCVILEKTDQQLTILGLCDTTTYFPPSTVTTTTTTTTTTTAASTTTTAAAALPITTTAPGVITTTKVADSDSTNNTAHNISTIIQASSTSAATVSNLTQTVLLDPTNITSYRINDTDSISLADVTITSDNLIIYIVPSVLITLFLITVCFFLYRRYHNTRQHVDDIELQDVRYNDLPVFNCAESTELPSESTIHPYSSTSPSSFSPLANSTTMTLAEQDSSSNISNHSSEHHDNPTSNILIPQENTSSEHSPHPSSVSPIDNSTTMTQAEQNSSSNISNPSSEHQDNPTSNISIPQENTSSEHSPHPSPHNLRPRPLKMHPKYRDFELNFKTKKNL